MAMQFQFNIEKPQIEVGIDEAGRGSLLGPVFAAAVIWNPEICTDLALQIKDSKKLSAKKRELLATYIEEHAIAFGVGSVDAQGVDSLNILNASFNAMHTALDQVSRKTGFDYIIVDGNRFKTYMNPNGDFMPHTCIVDGDNKFVSIAAASILAKVYHDKWIKDILQSNPELAKYGIATNQGYGSKKHLDAIKEYGITSFHRKSYKCCK
jgi:ribonuclease HII